MIATKESFEPHSSEQLPNSKKVFVPGKIHAGVRVPMREIEVSPTKSYTGAVGKNAAGRVKPAQEVYVVVAASRLSAREQILESYVTAGLPLVLAAERQGDRFGL